MATPQKFKPVQDMPPRGGYPPVDITRRLRPRGPPGWAIWLGFTVATVYGFYVIGQTNIQTRYNRKEKREARMAIVPILQAEADQRLHKEYIKYKEQEAEAMKHVTGWNVDESIYKTRWMPKYYQDIEPAPPKK